VEDHGTMSETLRIPAMANAHSHAFQIGLRGAAERPAPQATGTDDFWSWRTEMYRLAGALDPDSIAAVGARAYREMAHAGYGSVGEFHYVHHQPDGRPYDEPNAMAIALANAAITAGLEIALLPAAYHRGGWDGEQVPPNDGQRRFCDPDVETFLARVEALRTWTAGRAGVRVGIAVHSVRAVPATWIEAVAAHSERHGLVRHVHACEQRRELEECRAEHDCTPIELLERCGFLGPRTAIVHGIHVSARDIELLAASGTTVISCPTTEGNLGDGYLPALRYRDAGVPLAIGTDSQARIDPFEETRELETGARREGQTRFALLAANSDLWAALAASGRAALGLDGPAPHIEIDTEHPDLAGVGEGDMALALATCASAAVVARGVAG
jgi:formimidoylglutamate deiminase